MNIEKRCWDVVAFFLNENVCLMRSLDRNDRIGIYLESNEIKRTKALVRNRNFVNIFCLYKFKQGSEGDRRSTIMHLYGEADRRKRSKSDDV